jgi:hypothetical protein
MEPEEFARVHALLKDINAKVTGGVPLDTLQAQIVDVLVVAANAQDERAEVEAFVGLVCEGVRLAGKILQAPPPPEAFQTTMGGELPEAVRLETSMVARGTMYSVHLRAFRGEAYTAHGAAASREAAKAFAEAVHANTVGLETAEAVNACYESRGIKLRARAAISAAPDMQPPTDANGSPVSDR